MALVVFTGGARSGKSAAAQRLAQGRALDGASVVVVVFGRSESSDPEFEARVERHRSDRPSGFTTVEASDSVGWATDVPDDALLLVDCLGTLLGLAMEEAWDALGADSGGLVDAPADALPDGLEAELDGRFTAALVRILDRRSDTIVVTNEVGDGIVPTYATGRLFRDVLGRANRMLADRADAAYLVVGGRLIDLTALPRDAAWPED